MVQARSLIDPLGNIIVFPTNLLTMDCRRSYTEIEKVITAPAYIIQVGKAELYFFRLLEWELNLLVEAKAKESNFIVEGCTENPTVENISSLLKKGSLISFH